MSRPRIPLPPPGATLAELEAVHRALVSAIPSAEGDARALQNLGVSLRRSIETLLAARLSAAPPRQETPWGQIQGFRRMASATVKALKPWPEAMKQLREASRRSVGYDAYRLPRRARP